MAGSTTDFTRSALTTSSEPRALALSVLGSLLLHAVSAVPGWFALSEFGTSGRTLVAFLCIGLVATATLAIVDVPRRAHQLHRHLNLVGLLPGAVAAAAVGASIYGGGYVLAVSIGGHFEWEEVILAVPAVAFCGGGARMGYIASRSMTAGENPVWLVSDLFTAAGGLVVGFLVYVLTSPLWLAIVMVLGWVEYANA